LAKPYTDEELQILTDCPKIIKNGPKKAMSTEGQYQRSEMDLIAEDNDALTFHVFMRRNLNLKEDFPIGLNFRHIEERDIICLLRCNGPHGIFLGQRDPDNHYFKHHIHRAKQSNLEAGQKPEKGGEETTAYASYEDALTYFLTIINVQNVDEFFPDRRQPPLFLLSDEDEG